MLKILKIVAFLYLCVLFYFKLDFILAGSFSLKIMAGLFVIVAFYFLASFKFTKITKPLKANFKEDFCKRYLRGFKLLDVCFILSPGVFRFNINYSSEWWSWVFVNLFLWIIFASYTELKIKFHLVNAILAWFLSSKRQNFMRINYVYVYLSIKDLQAFNKADSETKIKMLKEEAKELDKDDVKFIENALASLKLDEFVKLRLGQEEFFIKDEFLEQILNLIKISALNSERISKSDFIDEVKKTLTITLNDEETQDFIALCESVCLYYFEDGEFFIHNQNLDHFSFCASCGMAYFGQLCEEGEYYCSSLCEDTERICEELSEELMPCMSDDESYEEYNERRKEILGQAPAIVANTMSSLGVSMSWAKNFQVLQNLKTGHGFAAEIMNHENEGFFKILTGKAKIVGGNNLKDGADRVVDGIEIQTKYYKTAQRSVNAAFDNKGTGNYRYIGKNGKPMQLEVPKDQYEKAIKAMEEKIKQGKVQGVSDPKQAKKIIRKGEYTLNEAKNYAKFCTKESLTFDAKSGAVVAFSAVGISFIISTASSLYRGVKLKDAFKQSFIFALASGGKAFAAYMIGAQLQRLPVMNNLLQQLIDFKFKGVIGEHFSKSLASMVGKGTAKETARITAANSALRGQVVAAAAMMTVMTTIDLTQMMRGKISGMQCVKNAAVNAGGLAGGVAGAVLGAAAGSFVPVVGTAIGGFVGGLVGGLASSIASKKIADKFIEDDIVKKQRIFMSRMLNLATSFRLSEYEAERFKILIDNIISNDKDFFDKIHANKMLQSSNQILKPIVVSIVSTREKIPNIFSDEKFIAQIADSVEQDLEKVA